MQIHEIIKNNKNKGKKIIGRGGTRGKTSGRGHKGQKARAGHKIRPAIRDAIKKLPKQRGYRFNSIKDKPAIVNLSDIEKIFNAGDKVNPETLIQKGLLEMKGGRTPMVKILAKGDLSKKVELSGCFYSETVKNKVNEAGGSVA